MAVSTGSKETGNDLERAWANASANCDLPSHTVTGKRRPPLSWRQLQWPQSRVHEALTLDFAPTSACPAISAETIPAHPVAEALMSGVRPICVQEMMKESSVLG